MKLKLFYLNICQFVMLNSFKTLTIYLFSFFTGNGKNDMHLTNSLGCFRSEALNDREPFFAPEIGDKVLYAPCNTRGGDVIQLLSCCKF